MSNSEMKSENLYKLATSKALKGDIKGRDLAGIVRYQFDKSYSIGSFSEEEYNSPAMKVAILIQTKFN